MLWIGGCNHENDDYYFNEYSDSMTFETNVLKGSHATQMSQGRGLIIGHVPMPRSHPYKFVLGALSLHDCRYQFKH